MRGDIIGSHEGQPIYEAGGTKQLLWAIAAAVFPIAWRVYIFTVLFVVAFAVFSLLFWLVRWAPKLASLGVLLLKHIHISELFNTPGIGGVHLNCSLI